MNSLSRVSLPSVVPSRPEKLRLLDLFSGIGGFSLGLERTGGFETVAFCEISAKCRHLLNHHWPEVPAYDDICTLTADRLAADGIGVDAICGGFPCQDISLAGAGAGLAGERSGLWREYARLVGELRPRVVIVENVSALLGRGLGVVLGDLAALGYDAGWDCIPASAVGAPHRRDRLWLVAYARGEQHEGYSDALRRAVATQLSYANAAGEGWSEGLTGDGGEALAHTMRPRGRGRDHQRQDAVHAHPRRQAVGAGSNRGWWTIEPDVGRVANGIPKRVDRLHGLGNAVVPQIPEILGRAILEARAAA
jgi:DNA (cytosine-5)-methyltransferase 1